MRVFVSWSGARSQALATAMREWLPNVVEGIEVFHSEDISKGESWHSTLIKELRDCHVGVFCVTPESLRSQWMLFEAGALAQHGDRPNLFTYLYGTGQLSGPLSYFQATRFDRDDSCRFAVALANAVGVGDEDAVIARFDRTWDWFESKVLELMFLPVQQLVPDFPALFENKKTFHESFLGCSNKLWEDRLRRVVRTHCRLSQEDIAEILSSDPYLRSAYSDLLSALDRYDMHIAAHLMNRVDFEALGANEQRQLEDARKRIVDIIFTLQRSYQPPVFRESLSFESEPATEKRKTQIHEMEARLRRGELPKKKLLAACDSLSWALDRIVFYLASGADHLPEIQLKELISYLRREEEIARTRNLVKGLQPLYYVAECIDNRMTEPLEAPLGTQLREILDDVERFLQGDSNRDSGGHIRRRITSIRRKLE